MSQLEVILDGALRWSPAQAVMRRKDEDRLNILAYHGVSDPARFAKQIEVLVSEMTPVSLNDVLGHFGGHQDLPARPVLVTFDDGERSVYQDGLPILRQMGVPAALFVLAGSVGTDEPFWWVEVEQLVRAGGRAGAFGKAPSAQEYVRWMKRMEDTRRLEVLDELRRSVPNVQVRTPQLTAEELREMEGTGMAIGNHTLTHPCLDRCDDEKVEREVCEAHERLTAILGHPPRAFAYPNGNRHRRAATHLIRLGYEASFLFDHRVCKLPIRDRYAVSRVRVDSTTPIDRFRIILSGLHPAIHHLLGRR